MDRDSTMLRLLAIGGKAMVSLIGVPVAFLLLGFATMGDCIDESGDVGPCGLGFAGILLLLIGVVPLVAALIPFRTRIWIAAPIYAVTGTACVLGAALTANAAIGDASRWPFLVSLYLLATAVGLAAATIRTYRAQHSDAE